MEIKNIDIIHNPIYELFLHKVDKQNCWEWTASKNKNGYGHFWFRGKMWKSHRVSYILHKEEIPIGLNVLHSCDNPSCVNPEHLFLGTQADNVKDMMEKGRHGDNGCERSGHARLTKVDVEFIRNNPQLGYKYFVETYKIDKSMYYKIKNKINWKF